MHRSNHEVQKMFGESYLGGEEGRPEPEFFTF